MKHRQSLYSLSLYLLSEKNWSRFTKIVKLDLSGFTHLCEHYEELLGMQDKIIHHLISDM